MTTTAMIPSKDAILVVVGNESTRMSIAKSLKEAGYDVVLAGGEAAAFDAIQGLAPALILVDRRVGSYGKLRAHKALRTTPIIAREDPATTCADEECVDDLEQGADVVLCNPNQRELVARIRAMLRRKQSAPPPVMLSTSGGIEMDLDRHEVRINGRPVELTPKEFQILRCFLEHPSRVFSRQDILNSVWGEGYALEEHALDVHIHSLRHKIEADPSKPKIIVTVRGVGYKLRHGA